MGYNYYLVCVVGFALLSSFTVSSTDSVPLYWSVHDSTSLNRSSFPSGFIFGAGSSAYQFEGAANEGGRGPSIWDTFTHQHPEKIKDGSNGDVAVDQYHRYEEDVKIMKDMNLDSYRFSISWSRILPKGKLSGGINHEGIEYYHNLIDELLAEGIKPFVTLFHWDLPQALEDEYGGFLNSSIIEDFRDYADLCFQEFGNKVTFWVTLNEPHMFSQNGYANGVMAPGRCSDHSSCTGGDSGTEPYIVTHNQILAHAEAVRVYKTKYQEDQKGKIGITLVGDWFIPLAENRTSDQRAAKRALDFQYGWFMEPLTKGEYPKTMRLLVKSRLPKFNESEARLVNGSFDFIGLNYYSSSYINDVPRPSNYTPNYLTDSLTHASFERDGRPLGLRAASFWLYVYPKGLLDILSYTKNKYNNPLIYINENGMSEFDDSSLSVEESLLDTYRIDYYYRHFYYIRLAIKNGTNVKGYFAWSFLDHFEWGDGFTIRFGLNFVNYNDSLKRYPKLSAQWYRNFLRRN